MNYLKGTAVDFIHIKFRSNPGLEEKFLLRLTPEAQNAYITVLPVTRVEAEIGAMIFEAASTLLYAQYPHPVRRLGYEHSQHDLKGIYRVILKMVSIPYIIQKASQLWRTYHLQGEATVEFDANGKKGVMTVRNYPDMPNAYLESTTGYIQGTLELAGAKNIIVEPSRNQNESRWNVAWE